MTRALRHSAILIAAAACASVSPSGGRLADRYVLVTANGNPITQPIHPTPTDDTWVDSSWIVRNGTRTVGRTDFVRGIRAGKLEDWSGPPLAWEYMLTGDSITLVPQCAPNTHCAGWEYGVVRGDTILLTASRFGDAILTYVRAP